MVVGGNAFITNSIPDGAKVSVKSQELMFRYSSDTPVETREINPEETCFTVI